MGWYNDGEGNITWGDLAGNEYGSDPNVNPNVSTGGTQDAPSPNSLQFPSIESIMQATTTGMPGSPEMRGVEAASEYAMAAMVSAFEGNNPSTDMLEALTEEQKQAIQYAKQVMSQNQNYPKTSKLMEALNSIAKVAIPAVIGMGIGGVLGGIGEVGGIGGAAGTAGADLGSVVGAAGELGAGGSLASVGTELAASTAAAGGLGSAAAAQPPAGGAPGGTGITTTVPETPGAWPAPTGAEQAGSLTMPPNPGVGTTSLSTMGGGTGITPPSLPGGLNTALGTVASGTALNGLMPGETGGVPNAGPGGSSLYDSINQWLSGGGQTAFPWTELLGAGLGLYGQNQSNDLAKELMARTTKYDALAYDAASKGIGDTNYGKSIADATARKSASMGYNMSGNMLHDIAQGLNTGTNDYLRSLHGYTSLDPKVTQSYIQGPSTQAQSAGNILGILTGNNGQTQNIYQGLNSFLG